eukprot:scaffold311668_cov37-Tisochrysis_lutea.AAC.2
MRLEGLVLCFYDGITKRMAAPVSTPSSMGREHSFSEEHFEVEVPTWQHHILAPGCHPDSAALACQRTQRASACPS